MTKILGGEPDVKWGAAEAVHSLLSNLGGEAKQMAQDANLLDSGDAKRITTELLDLLKLTPTEESDMPNATLGDDAFMWLYQVDGRLLEKVFKNRKEDMENAIMAQLVQAGLQVLLVDLQVTGTKNKTQTLQCNVFLTINQAVLEFMEGKRKIWFGEGEMKCKLSGDLKEEDMPAVCLQGNKIASLLRILHFLNPHEWTYRALMVQVK